jgi:hypothetical protein
MGDHGTFGGETFSVFGLFFEVGKGDEEREIGVLVPGGLEAVIEVTLNRFPNGKPPRFDHHAATGFGILGKISSADDLLIPFGKILRAGRSDCRFWLRHNEANHQAKRQ